MEKLAVLTTADATERLRRKLNEVIDSLAAKQDALVSTVNIKTINGTSVLGSGNLTVAGGGGGNSYFPSGF
jgi:hypothetical protein